MFVCRVFLDIKFSTHLGKYQGAQLLDHMARLCLVPLEMNESGLLLPCQHLVLSGFLNLLIN